MENYFNLRVTEDSYKKMHGIDVSHIECCDIRCLRCEKLFEFKIHIQKMHELDVSCIECWGIKCMICGKLF